MGFLFSYPYCNKMSQLVSSWGNHSGSWWETFAPQWVRWKGSREGLLTEVFEGWWNQYRVLRPPETSNNGSHYFPRADKVTEGVKCDPRTKGAAMKERPPSRSLTEDRNTISHFQKLNAKQGRERINRPHSPLVLLSPLTSMDQAQPDTSLQTSPGEISQGSDSQGTEKGAN